MPGACRTCDDDGDTLPDEVTVGELQHTALVQASCRIEGPRRFMPGAYVQYVCFDGTDKTSNVVNEREFSENYCELLPKLESLLEMSIIKQYPVPASMLREDMVKNYPYWAIRELIMNGKGKNMSVIYP